MIWTTTMLALALSQTPDPQIDPVPQPDIVTGAESDLDGLFGQSEAGSDTLLGQIEQMVRGGDGPPPRNRNRVEFSNSESSHAHLT